MATRREIEKVTEAAGNLIGAIIDKSVHSIRGEDINDLKPEVLYLCLGSYGASLELAASMIGMPSKAALASGEDLRFKDSVNEASMLFCGILMAKIVEPAQQDGVKVEMHPTKLVEAYEATTKLLGNIDDSLDPGLVRTLKKLIADGQSAADDLLAKTFGSTGGEAKA